MRQKTDHKVLGVHASQDDGLEVAEHSQSEVCLVVAAKRNAHGKVGTDLECMESEREEYERN